MELITQIVQEIYSALSPGELTVLITLLLSSVPLIFKIIWKIVSNRRAMSILTGENGPDTQFSQLTDKIGDIITKEDYDNSVSNILRVLTEIKNQLAENEDLLRDQDTNIEIIKKDLEDTSHEIKEEISEIKSRLRMQDTHSEQLVSSIKDSLQRIHDNLIRLTSQIDKIDEFAKAAIPEFRSYHKELAKEIGDVSKDLALIERTIDTQINNIKSIKLR